MMAKKHLGQVRLTSWRMAPCTTTAVPTWAFIDWLSPKSYVLPKHFFSRPNPDTLKFWTLLYEILVLGQLRGRVSSKLSLWHSLGTPTTFMEATSTKTDGQITKPTSTNYLLWMLRIHLSSQWKKAKDSQKDSKEFFCSTEFSIFVAIFSTLAAKQKFL